MPLSSAKWYAEFYGHQISHDLISVMGPTKHLRSISRPVGTGTTKVRKRTARDLPSVAAM